MRSRDNLTPRQTAIAAALVVLAAWAEVRYVAFNPTSLVRIEGWFYPVVHRGLGPIEAWVVIAVAALLALAGALWRKVRAPAWWFVLGGVAMQLGCAFIEDRGVTAIRDRTINSGHAEFAKIACKGTSVHDVVFRYEHFISYQTFGVFSSTKPPGTLLFYVLTERLSHVLFPTPDPATRLGWFADVATFAWPLCAALAVVPLYFLGRAVFTKESARLGAAFFVVVPSFALITLHTDQVLFPLVVNTALLVAAHAGLKSDLRLAALGGVLAYVAGYCSFGLLAGSPLFIACVALGAARGRFRERWSRDTLRTMTGALIGFAVTWVLVGLITHYNLPERYTGAMEAHLAYKEWKGTRHEVAHFAFVDILEFVLWLGAPVAVLAALGAFLGVDDAARARRPTPLLFATTVAAIVLGLALFGRTKAETARLWLFLAGPACIAAGETVRRVFADFKRTATFMLIVAQVAIAIAMKRFQDFW